MPVSSSHLLMIPNVKGWFNCKIEVIFEKVYVWVCMWVYVHLHIDPHVRKCVDSHKLTGCEECRFDQLCIRFYQLCCVGAIMTLYSSTHCIESVVNLPALVWKIKFTSTHQTDIRATGHMEPCLFSKHDCVYPLQVFPSSAVTSELWRVC